MVWSTFETLFKKANELPLAYATKTGKITKATNNEDTKLMERVAAKSLKNAPSNPPKNISGRKTDIVVKVEAVTGRAISLVPCFADSNLSNPCFL